jgi:hypothetical protein
MGAGGARTCGAGHQPEPSRDDAAHSFPRLWIPGKRRVFHTLPDFKPPNRNFRRIRNRFIDIGCHALMAYYCLWHRWQDKAVNCARQTVESNRLPYPNFCVYERPKIGLNFGFGGHYPRCSTTADRIGRSRNQIAELVDRQFFGNDLRSQFPNGRH